MSDKQSSGLFSFNFAAIVAFVLSLVGIDAFPGKKNSPEVPAVQAPATQTDRQANADSDKRAAPDTELPTLPNVRTEIAGRWADPFKGRKKALTECPETACRTASNCSQFQDLQCHIESLTKGQTLTILPIQLDAGDLPSQQETRINTRHAVEYALATAGYQMDFEDRMSYVSPRWEIWFAGKFRCYRGEVPIKLYSRRTPAKTASATENNTEHLLVCWIDNQLLGSKRIQTLVTMLQDLLGCNLLKKSRVRFIGPSYSSEVAQVQQEIAEWTSQTDPPEVWNTSSLSTFCGDFQAIAPAATSPAKSTITLNDSPEFRLTCIMADDKCLARDLVSELMLRRRQYGHVLIVREAGTGSPDNLSQKITENLQQMQENSGQPGPATLTYLKHIAFGENGAPISDKNRGLDDYFQRQLANITQNRGFSGDDVSAVFVIGNDTQDKLTILKNLKPLFPNATFFTHDLHYSFYKPETLPFTRGLVVGSRGTLSADDKPPTSADTMIQPGIVFRDCYQKATYQAVLSSAAPDLATPDNVGKITLYEVGFNGPFLLSTPFGWNRPLRLLGITAGLLLTLAVIAFVRTEQGQFQTLQKLRIYLTYGVSEIRSLLISLSPVDEKNQAHPPTTHGPPVLHLFPCIFDLRTELGIAGICTLSVWKFYLHDPTHGAISTFFGIVFIPLTVVMVMRSLITLWPSQTTSAGKPAPDLAVPPVAEHRLFRLWLHFFLLICAYYTGADTIKNIPLIQEPFSLTSGISSWPVLAGLLAVVGVLTFWLRFTWQRARTAVDILIAQPSEPQSISGEQDSEPPLFSKWQGMPATSNSPESSCKQSLEYQRTIAEDRLQVAVRIAMLGLLILFACGQYHSSNSWLGNWGLLPLPPTRGSVLLAFMTMISTLGLLLTLNACLSGLIQVRLLLSYISQKQTECMSLPQRPPATQNMQRYTQVCYEVCLFVQESTSKTIRHSLRNPALLLLAYSCCRLPVLESWAASTNTILLIAGIPTIIAVTLALQLRFSSNKVRSLIIAWLNASEFSNDNSGPKASATSKAAAADNRTAIKICRDQIIALNQGAFSNIWQDPILGTVFFLATALGSSQGFNPITFLLGFIPG